jgi:hypothetical protein
MRLSTNNDPPGVEFCSVCDTPIQTIGRVVRPELTSFVSCLTCLSLFVDALPSRILFRLCRQVLRRALLCQVRACLLSKHSNRAHFLLVQMRYSAHWHRDGVYSDVGHIRREMWRLRLLFFILQQMLSVFSSWQTLLCCCKGAAAVLYVPAMVSELHDAIRRGCADKQFEKCVSVIIGVPNVCMISPMLWTVI